MLLEIGFIVLYWGAMYFLCLLSKELGRSEVKRKTLRAIIDDKNLALDAKSSIGMYLIDVFDAQRSKRIMWLEETVFTFHKKYVEPIQQRRIEKMKKRAVALAKKDQEMSHANNT